MLRVLLVDDDANLRDALEVVMVSAGHKVVSAGNGLEALAAAVTHPPQVIVSDVQMPVLQGPDMVRILKAVPQFVEVPVILMSGLHTTSGFHADRVLRKPFAPAMLLESIVGLEHSRGGTPLSASSAMEHSATAPDMDVPMSATAAQCAAHIRRGLQLIKEQEARMNGLRHRRCDTGLAEQSYDALVGCVVALASLETAAIATEDLW